MSNAAASSTAHFSNVGNPSSDFVPKWPDNLSELKLTPEEARVIEISTVHIKGKLPPDRNGSYHDVVLRRNIAKVVIDGEELILPRTLYITNQVAIVVLNKHGGMETIQGGAEQPEIKFAWDLVSGQKYVKKEVTTSFQQLFYGWLRANTEANFEGFAEIAGNYQYHGRKKVLQRFYPTNLVECMGVNPSIRIDEILKLQNALIKLHHFHYVPSSLTKNDGSFIRLESDGRVFHGDLSPRNILCTEPLSSEESPGYRFIDFGFSAKFHSVAYSIGYGSPETMQFLRGEIQMSTAEFNQKYGQKRDTWAFGLIVGSLLRSGFHPQYEGTGIPCFSFIANKLKTVGGKIDDSGIAELKQEEIDSKIDSIIERIDRSYPDGNKVKRAVINLWKCVRMWLRVDPDERLTVSECHIVWS